MTRRISKVKIKDSFLRHRNMHRDKTLSSSCTYILTESVGEKSLHIYSRVCHPKIKASKFYLKFNSNLKSSLFSSCRVLPGKKQVFMAYFRLSRKFSHQKRVSKSFHFSAPIPNCYKILPVSDSRE